MSLLFSFGAFPLSFLPWTAFFVLLFWLCLFFSGFLWFLPLPGTMISPLSVLPASSLNLVRHTCIAAAQASTTAMPASRALSNPFPVLSGFWKFMPGSTDVSLSLIFTEGDNTYFLAWLFCMPRTSGESFSSNASSLPSGTSPSYPPSSSWPLSLFSLSSPSGASPAPWPSSSASFPAGVLSLPSKGSSCPPGEGSSAIASISLSPLI